MKFFFSICFLIIFSACNGPQKKGSLSKDKFDAIENIVGTANWQFVDKEDTSYIYFSRINDVSFNVYRYKLVKGDSANTQMNNIVLRQDSVIWNWQNENWVLGEITGNSIFWKKIKNEKEECVIKQKDSLHLSINFPDGSEASLKKTLPLATFLVRSYYDNLHGTHTVDSPIVPPRKRLKKE